MHFTDLTDLTSRARKNQDRTVYSHVGIVGCSPPGAALCYEIIAKALSETTDSEHRKLQISLHSHPLSEYMHFIEGGDWDGVAELMLSSGTKLATSGADFLLAPCNTIHVAFDRVAKCSPLPWIHIASEVVAEAKGQGYKRIALLGTSFMMESPIYHQKFTQAGIDCLVPDVSERKRISGYIFAEMVHGNFTSQARQYAVDLIQAMQNRRCDAVALCCTELPLLIKDHETPLPLIDSTKILAYAAIRLMSGHGPVKERQT